MIGSHDSLTYLKSTSWIYNNCKKYWKTQIDSIESQYAFGIRMFDIRVCWDNKSRSWIPSHGKVNLKGLKWANIKEVLFYMKLNFPNAIFRLWLEKGDSSDKNKFTYEVTTAMQDPLFSDTLLWRAGIKSSKEWKHGIFNQNQKLFDLGYKFALDETWRNPCFELHGSINDLDDAFRIDLRKEARKINGKLEFFKDQSKLKSVLESKDNLYFIDYCTNRY
jgi:hypothetical protein